MHTPSATVLQLLCDSFPEPRHPVNVQSDDPCGEDSAVHWPAKFGPPALLPLE